MSVKKDFCEEVAEYVVGRTANNNDIQAFYKQNYESEKTFYEFIYDIAVLRDEFFDRYIDGEDMFSDDDEIAYVMENTGIDAPDIVELILWYCKCFCMSNGLNTWMETCRKCGYEELYERENRFNIRFLGIRESTC